MVYAAETSHSNREAKLVQTLEGVMGHASASTRRASRQASRSSGSNMSRPPLPLSDVGGPLL